MNDDVDETAAIEKCGTCKFYQFDNRIIVIGDAEGGRCRRKSPKVMPFISIDGKPNIASFYPTTTEDEWCGEYKHGIPKRIVVDNQEGTKPDNVVVKFNPVVVSNKKDE